MYSSSPIAQKYWQANRSSACSTGDQLLVAIISHQSIKADIQENVSATSKDNLDSAPCSLSVIWVDVSEVAFHISFY